jgi:hypothetical protein
MLVVRCFHFPSILPDDFENEDEDENDLSRILHLASPIPQTPDPAPAFPRISALLDNPRNRGEYAVLN